MLIIKTILCCVFIFFTARMLLKRYNPQSVLLFSGLLMMAVAALLGIEPLTVKSATGAEVFDLFKVVEEKFLTSIVSLGFMIMTIGGYVALMNKIKATDVMVYIATKPLAFLRGKPYLAAVFFIPIGMLIYLTIPSASGLGLLLVSTIYPILIRLGSSKLTALSVISAATIFDMGPGSANTIKAAEILNIDDHVGFFIGSQLPLVIPTTIFLMVVYYYTNRYFDKKDLAKGKELFEKNEGDVSKPNAPSYFALLPILPLAFLIIFSKYLGLFAINISTALAMLVCVVIVALVLIVHNRSISKSFKLLESFWNGMGSVFSSVVTLIVTAEIFAIGLNSLDFINLLINGTSSLGFGAIAIIILMTFTLFFSATMMGSGNAAFFSFGPLVPESAAKLGTTTLYMLLPMQLCAGMGRATSPIAAVNVAIAGAAGESPLDVAKRNMIPMISGAIFLMVIHFIFN